jgi:hypothetical protein
MNRQHFCERVYQTIPKFILMKIIIFDEILEAHVCEALTQALTALGHNVFCTGKVWHGHSPPSKASDIQLIDAIVDDLIARKFDALFNFRACSLLPRHVAALRAAGQRTAVWLPDDPVLYQVSYKDIVDSYDLVLHCGDGSVLDFYDARGHKKGVNFPFWVDPTRFVINRADCEPVASSSGECNPWVFLGNLVGPVRGGRYAQLAVLNQGLDIWGKCNADPTGMHRGYLQTIDEVAGALAQYQVGINIPQFFRDYAGTSYDFAGLGDMGNFFIPSRVVQYAAAGLPVVSIGPNTVSNHFPLALQVKTAEQALGVLTGLLSQHGVRAAISAASRAHVVANFSGLVRAKFLVALFSGHIDPATLGLHEREFAYGWWGV